MLDNDPDQLRAWKVQIEGYLLGKLALELNRRQRLAPVSNDIDFLGYIVRRDYKMVRKYPLPSGLRVVRQQYRYFRWRFPEDVLFFRVGRFFEFYDIGESQQLACHDLKKMGCSRRGARHGFPVYNLKRNLARLLSQGATVLLSGEKESVLGGIRRPTPLCRFAPPS